MVIAYKPSFVRDVKGAPPAIQTAVADIMAMIEVADGHIAIPTLKKLSVAQSTYVIRMGDYTLVFYFADSSIILTRFLHRKDIYKFNTLLFT